MPFRAGQPFCLLLSEFVRGASIVFIGVELDECCLDAEPGDLRVMTLSHILPLPRAGRSRQR